MREDLDLNAFKEHLEERLAVIQTGRAAQQQEGEPIELDQTKVGRLSRMDAMQQQAMAQATARRTEVELQRIRTALGRLQSGDYGYCVKCEEEIAEGRLRADPASLVCIDCARAAEGK
jgi:DnaK suppressor protein